MRFVCIEIEILVKIKLINYFQVHDLPDYHFETLQHLMFHLKKVVDYSDINKMEARNLAIVFGPNLVRTADNNMVTMVTDMSHQCKIVETVLSNVCNIFGNAKTFHLHYENIERLLNFIG